MTLTKKSSVTKSIWFYITMLVVIPVDRLSWLCAHLPSIWVLQWSPDHRRPSKISKESKLNWRREESLQNPSSTLSVWSSMQKSLPLKPRFDFEAIDAIQYLSEQQKVRCTDFWKVESQLTLLSHLQKKAELNLGKHSHWSILYSERICQMIHMAACNLRTVYHLPFFPRLILLIQSQTFSSKNAFCLWALLYLASPSKWKNMWYFFLL